MAEPATPEREGDDDFPGAERFLPEQRDLRSLRSAIEACRGCPLHRDATHAVFGEGRTSAQLMLVGEVPGHDEDLVGTPFVGPSGRLLDEALGQAGIDRDSTYVTNVVKHFKWEPRGRRRLHRTPNRREIDACLPWLDAEIERIRPRVLMALGATAAKTLFGSSHRVTRQRGELVPSERADHALSTLHPSAILRLRGSEERKQALDGFIRDLRVAHDLLADT